MTTVTAISARVPAPLTPLIGRDGRVETAWQALQGTRLLTLTGPGGSGKTRLAVELASRVERAGWVELAALADPRALGEHVALALGVFDRSGKPSPARIAERYAPHPLLLVLDNCEHVIDAAAAFISALLRTSPSTKVLATSREALGVPGERTLAVPPLSLPADDSLDAARGADAVVLFVERAQDVRAGFELTPRNAPAVARICRRLDGIPLAIELAAARVRALGPEQLAERLESSVGLLETGSRAALPRHRTIRDTLDWSYRLLSSEERTLLRRLSVFTGSFSLDAVELVCAGPGDLPGATLDRLTGLLDKSLLLYDAGDTGARYRLLETVREYAAEHLDGTGETDAIRERHARFFVGLAERAAPAIAGGAGDEGWMARLDEEAPNFRDAHDWCEQESSRLELSLRLAVALQWYWFARGRFNEWRLRIGIALTFAEGIDPALRGRALTALGRLAIWQGDCAHVQRPMEEAVETLRRYGDTPSLADALHGLGIAAALQGRSGEARRFIDEAAALADPAGPLMAWIEYWRGQAAEWTHDPDAARPAYERALAIGRRLNHTTAIGHALAALGHLAAAGSRPDAAAQALQEALAVLRDIGDQWGVTYALQGLARTAVKTGQASQAAALLGAAHAVREDLGIDAIPPLRASAEATIAEARGQIGEAAFWRAWAAGKTRPLAETIAGALSPPAPLALSAAAPAAAPVDLRIRMLGAFETVVRNRRVEKTEWGSCRARELLAYLACHPDGRTKAQIGLALWPDASPGQLRNVFHVTLHRLRHALSLPDAIQADGDRYRLNGSLSREIDAERFEQDARAAMRELRRGGDATAALDAAAARYRGELLAGESVGDWADEWRDRLRQLHLDALDTLGLAHMARERFVEAAEAWRTLLAADPVNEEACRRHMVCLDRMGDRTGALRAYDALVRALRDELNVGPERQTAALRDKLSARSVV